MPTKYSSPSTRWTALLTRDPSASNSFIYGVQSTKIYCRPCCPSRLARRANITFYDTPADAEAAGYRACRRCKPDVPAHEADVQEAQRELVRRACEFIVVNEGRVRVQDVVRCVGGGRRRLFRLFEDVLGVTPGKFAEGVRRGREEMVSMSLSAGSGVGLGAVSTPLVGGLVEPSLVEPGFDSDSWSTLLGLDNADDTWMETSESYLPYQDVNGISQLEIGGYGKDTTSTRLCDILTFREDLSITGLSQLDPYLEL